MDPRLRGNDIASDSAVSRASGNDAIDNAVVAATTVIPAQAGIHSALTEQECRSVAAAELT